MSQQAISEDLNFAVKLENISKLFGSIVALSDVSLQVRPGEVLCLLGDNGAGKSTLIKVLSGVHKPTTGRVLVGGKEVSFSSPKNALDHGIATVYQDLAMIPLMSITRNFFMGREIQKKLGPIKLFDLNKANQIVLEEMQKIGIKVREPTQAVGTLSGGERQSVAIARAVFFGAKVLVLDEPTSALGVAQTTMVLKYINQLRQRGIAIIFITHNVRHAFYSGDAFTILNRGRILGHYQRDEITMHELQELMAGGKELDSVTNDFT